MVGILLTLLAVILVICLVFCHSGRSAIVHELANQALWNKGKKTTKD